MHDSVSNYHTIANALYIGYLLVDYKKVYEYNTYGGTHLFAKYRGTLI